MNDRKPVDNAPMIAGGFGVDEDPYTDDDSREQGCCEGEGEND